MTKTRLLLALIALAACCVLVALWQRQPAAAPPPIDPASADANLRAAPPAAVGEAVPAAPRAGAASPVRVQAPGERMTDPRPCQLTVCLQFVTDGFARPQPSPFAEVTVAVGDEPAAGTRITTDANGEARLQFDGGAGQRVVATTGAGGRATATLSADEPTTVTVTIAPRVFVQGRVLDAGGVGVPGADVVLLRWPEREGARSEIWSVGRSGRDGHYRVALRAGGRIGATMRGYAPSPLFLVRPAAGDVAQVPTQTFDLTLLGAAARVVGTVRDMDGRPLADADIDLRPSGRTARKADLAAPPTHATSAADGTFRADGLPEGELLWWARKRGFGWASGALRVSADADQQLAIVLPWAATVTGTVVDADGDPVEGALVTAGESAARPLRTTTSSADGSFRLQDVGAGAIVLRASADGAHAQTTLELPPGREATWRAVLVAATRGPELRGRVVDERDAPLAGWRVVVRQRGHKTRAADTDERGAFAIAVAAPTGLDVRVFAPGRAITAFADALRQDVDAGAGELLVRARNGDAGVVRGRVVDAAFRGVPATLDAWHEQRREFARFTADEQGVFELRDVPAGTVELTLQHSGHCPAKRSVVVQPAEATDVGTIALQQAGGLFGAVTTTAGTPPSTCEIALLTRGELPQRMLADYAAGSWRIADAPPGAHTLLVQCDGMAAASFDVKVEVGREARYDIELSPGLRRVVRVRAPPAAGDRVRLTLRRAQPSGDDPEGADGAPQRPRWFAAAAVQRARPDAVGVAEFVTWMAPGDYVVRAWGDGGHEAELVATYRFADEAAVELQLQR